MVGMATNTTDNTSTPRLGTRQRRCLRWLAQIEEWDPNDYTSWTSLAKLRSTSMVFAGLARHGLAEPTQQGVMFPMSAGAMVWGYRITDYGREVAATL